MIDLNITTSLIRVESSCKVHGIDTIYFLAVSSESLTDIKYNSSSILSKFVLEQNYPKPFNPSTSFEFVIPKSSFVSLKIYDVPGKETATLVNEEKKRENIKLNSMR